MAEKRKRPPRPSDAAAPAGTGEFRSGGSVRTGLIERPNFGIKAVQYAVVDGMAVFEGDIILGTEEQVAAQTQTLKAVKSGELARGLVITGSQYRWPNCVIPYTIDSGLSNQSRVTDAIAHWEANTRVRFVLRTAANAGTYPDYVTFRTGSGGCSSWVGRQGGQQFINLGSGCSTGNAIHEIGHTVGLWHEHSREDRDSFVTIHWDKILAGYEHNFNQHITDGDDVGAYDYGSIMHYPRDAFSTDGSDTITPLDPAATIGQRVALSAGDIAAANSLCPKPLKEAPIDTLKEIVKDIRLDTRKEQVFDTRKELAADTIKEMLKDRIKEVAKDAIKDVAYDPGTLKGASDVINPGSLLGQITQPGIGLMTGMGPLPFAVATAHQAPAAAAAPGQAAPAAADTVAQLDAQLQLIAEALAQAEATRETLQQQYNQTAALLKQAIEDCEKASGA